MVEVGCPRCGQQIPVLADGQAVRLCCPACRHMFCALADRPGSRWSRLRSFLLRRVAWWAPIGATLIVGVLLIHLGYRCGVALGPPASNPAGGHDGHTKNVPAPNGLVAAEKTLVEPLASDKAMGPEALFTMASSAVVRVVAWDPQCKLLGQGSGFSVSEDGLVVTSGHVVEGAAFATVALSDDTVLFVESIVSADPIADLALLKVNRQGLSFLELAEGSPPVGTKVYAIGSPEGLTNTLCEGLISGHRRIRDDLSLLQTTAAIGKGSSGGPLMTQDGEVAGVVTAFLASARNVGFAVSAQKARWLMANRPEPRKLASAGATTLDERSARQLKEALQALSNQREQLAEDILNRLVMTTADNPCLWFALGCLQGRLGNDRLAAEAYGKAVSLRPDFAEAYCSMGLSYGRTRQYEEAITALKTSIRLNPLDAAAYFHLGRAYLVLGRHDEAAEAFEVAIERNPWDSEYHLGLGWAMKQLGRHDEAMRAYADAIRLNPDGAWAHLCLGDEYARSKDYSRALEAYQAAARLDPIGQAGRLAKEKLASAHWGHGD